MQRRKGDTPCWGADPELQKDQDYLESDYHRPVWPWGAPGVAGAKHVELLSTPQPLWCSPRVGLAMPEGVLLLKARLWLESRVGQRPPCPLAAPSLATAPRPSSASAEAACKRASRKAQNWPHLALELGRESRERGAASCDAPEK